MVDVATQVGVGVPIERQGEEGMPCEALSRGGSMLEVLLPLTQLPTAVKVDKAEVKEEEEEEGAPAQPYKNGALQVLAADEGVGEEEAATAEEVASRDQRNSKRGRSALEEVGELPATRRRGGSQEEVPVIATPPAAAGGVPSQMVTGGEGEEQAGPTVPVIGPKQPSKGSGKGKKGSSGGKGKGKGKGGRSAHNRVVEVVAVRRSTRLRRGA